MGIEVIVCFLHDLQLYDLIRTVRNKTKIVFLNYYPITVIEVTHFLIIENCMLLIIFLRVHPDSFIWDEHLTRVACMNYLHELPA